MGPQAVVTALAIELGQTVADPCQGRVTSMVMMLLATTVESGVTHEGVGCPSM